LAHLLRLASLTLLASGAAALWLTGEIPTLLAIAFALAWAVALAHWPPPPLWHPWGRRLATAVVLAAIARVALGWHFAAVLYLVAFLGLHKAFTLRGALDHLHLLLLAFFMILAASIITHSPAFLAVLFAFVALAWVQLTCLTLLRAGDQSASPHAAGTAPAGASAVGSLSRPTAPSDALTPGTPFVRLTAGGALAGVATLAGAFVLFYVLPHWRTPGLSHAGLMGLATTGPAAGIGYSDSMTLDRIDALEPDRTHVLSLEARRPWFNPGPLPPTFHLRGRVLDGFDGREWSASPAPTLASSHWEKIALPALSAYHGGLVQQTIQQNVGVTARLFGADMPIAFDFSKLTYWGSRQMVGREPLRLLLDWQGRSLAAAGGGQRSSADPGHLWITYDVTSYLVPDAIALCVELQSEAAADQPPPLLALRRAAASSLAWQSAGLRTGSAGPNDPSLILDPVARRAQTALPQWAFADRLADLADRIMTRPDAATRIVQLHDWFQENFTYSLRPDTPRGMQPIEAFLTRTFKGHCEYFATGMALLLRAKGIPAHVVTGYYASEIAANRPGLIVRQSDAHAWVEVWLDGYGWLTVDPTPPEMRGQAAYHARASDGLWRRLRVSIRAWWQRYVIDFTEDQQIDVWSVVLASDFVQFFKDLLSPVVEVIVQGPISAPPAAGRERSQGSQLWKQSLLIIALTAVVGFLVLYDLRRRKKSAPPPPPPSTVAFMNQILRRLARLGWRRRAGQTAAEFLTEVQRQSVGRLTFEECLDLYHRYRYARHPRDRTAEIRVRQTIRELKDAGYRPSAVDDRP
jgi:transglutaminase-like putative cysteine protease